MLFFCLQYAWTHVIFWHGIQFHSVQWDHWSSMVRYHDHVLTTSSQRDVVQDTCRTWHLYVPSGPAIEAQGWWPILISQWAPLFPRPPSSSRYTFFVHTRLMSSFRRNKIQVRFWKKNWNSMSGEMYAELQTKLLHCFFTSNNTSNLHFTALLSVYVMNSVHSEGETLRFKYQTSRSSTKRRNPEVQKLS